MFVSLRAVAVLSTFAAQVVAIPKVTRTGRYLYTEDGTRFYIKGIGYQVEGNKEVSASNPFGEPIDFKDPLIDVEACKRDVPILQTAGVNAIRVYSVDPKGNHDECMKLFSDAGIYTILDLSSPPNGSITRDSPSWSTNLLDLYINTIDAFKGYDNIIAYNVGNEVATSSQTTPLSYIKAAARDTRAYLKSINSDALLGYSAINGNSTFRKAVADFLTCDLEGKNSDATAIDLWGLNEYTWCGDDTFEGSGYPGVMRDFADLQVAAYFSEYGCNRELPRLWTEVQAIFSTQLSDVLSGGIAFSYFPAESREGPFGMVTVSADGKTINQSGEFVSLSKEYNAIQPPNTPARSAAVASTYGSCAASAQVLGVSTTIPATPNESACNCLNTALSCRFTPQIADYAKLNGELIEYGCTELDKAGGTCIEIGGDSATGVYGRLSGCDPAVKASYVMSLFYENQKKNPEACNFGGSGFINTRASSTTSAEDLAGSCISDPNATFIPTAPAAGGGNGNTGGGNGNGDGDAGVSLLSGLSGVAAMAAIGALTATLTLL